MVAPGIRYGKGFDEAHQWPIKRMFSPREAST
jgi:hypothetical protein